MTRALLRLPLLLVCLSLSGLVPLGAHGAAAYPVKPVRLIVPFAPGGGNDLIARTLAHKLTEHWQQQVVVDNRAGGGGVIGTELAARATPDGYTLLLGHTGTLAINPTFYEHVRYEPTRDFTAVALVAQTGLILVVHPKVLARSVGELIELARASSGRFNFASGGVGTVSHLSGEMFNTLARLKLTHVSYRGTGPAIAELVGGQTQIMFSVFPAAIPHVRANRLRALAVTSAQRSKFLPDLPTVSESGLSGYESVSRYGVAAPRGLPAGITQKLSTAIRHALALPDVRQRLENSGAEPSYGAPDAYARLLRLELKRWAPVIRASGAAA